MPKVCMGWRRDVARKWCTSCGRLFGTLRVTAACYVAVLNNGCNLFALRVVVVPESNPVCRNRCSVPGVPPTPPRT